MKTINKIITKVNCKYGAPMGRSKRYPFMYTIVDMGGPHKFIVNPETKVSKTLFDCAMPMCGAYDRGGAYWGLDSQLKVSYTKDLTYVNFYRVDNN